MRQTGGDFTGMLLILILLMVVAGVGGLVAWKLNLFGLGGDDDDDDDDDDKSKDDNSKNDNQVTTHHVDTPPSGPCATNVDGPSCTLTISGEQTAVLLKKMNDNKQCDAGYVKVDPNDFTVLKDGDDSVCRKACRCPYGKDNSARTHCSEDVTHKSTDDPTDSNYHAHSMYPTEYEKTISCGVPDSCDTNNIIGCADDNGLNWIKIEDDGNIDYVRIYNAELEWKGRDNWDHLLETRKYYPVVVRSQGGRNSNGQKVCENEDADEVMRCKKQIQYRPYKVCDTDPNGPNVAMSNGYSDLWPQKSYCDTTGGATAQQQFAYNGYNEGSLNTNRPALGQANCGNPASTDSGGLRRGGGYFGLMNQGLYGKTTLTDGSSDLVIRCGNYEDDPPSGSGPGFMDTYLNYTLYSYKHFFKYLEDQDSANNFNNTHNRATVSVDNPDGRKYWFGERLNGDPIEMICTKLADESSETNSCEPPQPLAEGRFSDIDSNNLEYEIGVSDSPPYNQRVAGKGIRYVRQNQGSSSS